MTDKFDHRAAAEAARAAAYAWGQQAKKPTPEAAELSCLAYATVHALFAIHDTLEKLVDAYTQAQRRDHYALSDRHAANEDREKELEDAWQFRDWETVERLQDEDDIKDEREDHR